jgi:succinate dehydrogenase/fumarate reductase cytochrome b subunit
VSHLSDDDLVLHYYGEEGWDVVAAASHLHTCERCARAFDRLSRSLDAVTPPEFVGPIDETPALRQMLLERLREPESVRGRSRREASPDALAVASVWLFAVLYPLSLRVLFSIAQWAQNSIAVPLVPLMVIWACAGPLLAVQVLNRTPVDGGARASSRLLLLGALMAAISPALYLFVSRLTVGISMPTAGRVWYGALLAAALLSVVPWPGQVASVRRFVAVHRLSAVVLTVFVLGHVVNQALAFVSPAWYAAMRSVMRLASQQPVSYGVIVLAVAVQIVTGAVAGMKNVRAGAFARNLQAVSGWYLAAFLLVHVFSGWLPGALPRATMSAPINPFDLLESARSVAQLPFLLLGVATFLFHVGVYARLAALVYLAEASVRRLSYVGAVIGAAVVAAVGLSLCGVHL